MLRRDSTAAAAVPETRRRSCHQDAPPTAAPLAVIRIAVGSSGCETRRRHLPTYSRRPPACSSRSTADWIGVTIVDRARFGSYWLPPPALCSVSIGSVLVYTGPARLSLLHQLDGFHPARSHGDTQSPRSCPAPRGEC
jgi:hypothetical protein